MNDQEQVFVEAQRAWLNAHKDEGDHSWSVLMRRIGVSTALSAFAVGKYPGDNLKIADSIQRYRDSLSSQAEIDMTAPPLPDFFETPSTRRMTTMLSMAQRGRITLIATGPGTSKTKVLQRYQASGTNVWLTTLAPSSAGVNTMQQAVLGSLGEPDAKGTPFALSRRIIDRVRNSGGLLAIDEAQNATEKALEEIRSWHDATGIGICLAGNEDVLLRLEHGSRKHAFARLASRVANRLIFNVASEGDCLAFADAWGVDDARQRAFIVRIGSLPGSLRNCTMMLETAHMLAASERSALKLAHLQDAWAHLSTRPAVS